MRHGWSFPDADHMSALHGFPGVSRRWYGELADIKYMVLATKHFQLSTIREGGYEWGMNVLYLDM